MKKTGAIILMFLAVNTIIAQNGYVKFKKDAKIGRVKFYKDEIYPISKETSEKMPFYFSFGDTTFNVGNSVEKMQTLPDDKNNDKDNFVKSKSNGYIHIDVNTLNINDTIWFVSEINNRTPLYSIKVLDLNKSDVGSSFRLIIPNFPTICYITNNLTQLEEEVTGTETGNDGDEDPVAEGDPKGFFASLRWWQYFLLVLLFAGMGYGGWHLYLHRKYISGRETVLELYNGIPLIDFASKYNINLSELTEFNKDKFGKKFQKLDEKDKKSFLKELKNSNTLLIVGYRSKKPIEDPNPFPELNDNKKKNDDVSENKKHEQSQQYNQSKSADISHQLSQVENRIIEAIKNTNASGNINSNEIIRLKEEISGLKNEKNKIESEKESLNVAFYQLKNEKENLDKHLQEISNERTQLKSVLNSLQEKVIQVGYLSEYCENVLGYLNLCRKVSDDAYVFFNRVSQQKPEQSLIIEHLLVKFQNNIHNIPLGNWTQTVKDIKETGLTSNKLLIRSFSEINSNEERKREFQRLLFSEVITIYNSNILILAEEFRNLGHFQVAPELVGDIQNTFSKYVSEIIKNALTIEIETKYVPLFKNFLEFLGQGESVDKEVSTAYRNVQGLSKDSVAEVLLYGWSNTFGESKTKFIIA